MPTIHVNEAPEAALAARIAQLLTTDGVHHIAFSGGNTPRRMFEILAGDYAETIPWNRVNIYQVDERGVGPEHEDSNWKALDDLLVSCVPGIHAWRMEAERAGAEEDYAEILRNNLPQNEQGIPVFDAVILGLGHDGHTASLFPNTEALSVDDCLVVRNKVPALNTCRLTLTYPVINAAKHRWFLLRGQERQQIFREVLEGHHPAGMVIEPEWFIDHAASLH